MAGRHGFSRAGKGGFKGKEMNCFGSKRGKECKNMEIRKREREIESECKCETLYRKKDKKNRQRERGKEKEKEEKKVRECER